jgi:DNA adenine methylase
MVVFCAYEINNSICSELVNPTSEYSKEFVDLCKKFNTSKWITVDKLIENIPKKVKPFIKWAGGKKKLSNKILEQFPETYNTYYEPFIGGGAIGLSLEQEKKKYFSDINKKLIETYTSIQNNCEELILELKKEEYNNNKESFLKVRTKFNQQNDSLISSAMFIYLNKCCFNGLYRENLSGGFNVPFGNMKNPTICDEKLLKGISNYLQNVDIKCQSYSDITPEENDLVYFDPPYHETFSSYSKDGFSEIDQVSLKEFVDKLTEKKVKVILSNSNTGFIQKLYENYNKIVLDTKYSIGKNKTKIEEILITNFKK